MSRKHESGTLSIVIPAYDEQRGIASTLTQLSAVMEERDMQYEIIVVDDGSTDATAEIVRQHEGVRLLQHHSNRGYGAAIKTGIRQAHHEWIAIIDADGTYPPGALPALLAETHEHDMVIGARVAQDLPLLRRPAKWLLTKLAEYLAETKIPDLNSGLRLFKKEPTLRYFNILPSRFSFTITITIAFLSDHYLVKFVPIDYHKRKGKSKIRPLQDSLSFAQLILRTVMYFKPLKILLPVSFSLLLLALIIGFFSLLTQGKVMDITVVTLTMAAIQIAVIAMIADMIQKKGSAQR